jgi:hypothetical protein
MSVQCGIRSFPQLCGQLGKKARLAARLPAYGGQATIKETMKYAFGFDIGLAREIHVYLENCVKIFFV